ncbi:MAG: flagellar basal-body protein FlbY [Hyphomonadaceae bacterium]|nr:flagellar basal-body protein FlbY [Hyphomonadaceae bacterium]
MALIAEDAADRAAQLLLITERLTELVSKETALIEARRPPLEGEEGEERNRLANAYRLELARIKQEPTLIADAPRALVEKLKHQTTLLHAALADHEIALGAVKIVAEGLVQAMAEEVSRQRNNGRGYGARGEMAPAQTSAAVLDRNA